MNKVIRSAQMIPSNEHESKGKQMKCAHADVITSWAETVSFTDLNEEENSSTKLLL